ncbi:PAS domain S-box protein [Algoriphagus sp. H41]|uniref:histidine kinase n=1 Tax=Algoriphagus oliviformis TaxID=2811231 RepID=A0ABS3C3H2_9BACT|nr:PAS domain-containing sensor histidine kinase [Algoriphagus oliviformis]MBN7811154.1 PAS domain S-box protein [Algoriphagus oliviformis]
MLGRISRTFLLLTLGLWLAHTSAVGQSFKFNTNPKGVRLPVQNVLGMEQDSLGRMWFATARGVVYSDGIQSYELSDTLVKRFNYRISILKDEEGIMWLYNAVGAPLFFQSSPEGWQEVDFPKSEGGGYSSAIRFFPMGTGEEKYYFVETGHELFYWKEGEVEKRRIPRDFAQTGRLSSVLDDSGEIFLNFKRKTFKFKNDSLEAFEYRGVPLPSPPAMVKKSPTTGEYYFLGEDFLAKGPKAEFPTEIVSSDFSTEAMVEGDDFLSLEFWGDNVLFHFNSHLLKYNPSRNRPVFIDLSSQFNTIYLQTIFIDREGILWVGTSRGLANNNSQVFQNYGAEVSEFLGEELTAISDLGQGRFLFGFNNGLQIFSQGAIKSIYKDSFKNGLPNHRIFNFSKEGEERVWFSSNWGGVGIFNRRTESVSLIPPPADAGISSVQVVGDSVLVASGKRVFIAPLSARGRQLYSRELTQEIDSLLKERPVFFRKAGKLKNGKIIVLRASKLENRYPIIESPRYLLAEGYDFLELNDGSVLIGTEFGLKVYREGYLGYYLYQDKSITNSVFALMKDREEKIWAGTDNGVFVLGNGRVRHYNDKNGLVGDEINRGAMIESTSGRVMIGTQKGLSIYFPDEGVYATGTPKVYLTSVKLGDQEILGAEGAKVPYSQNLLEVSFMAAGFNEARELWIHYRLKDSEDAAWTVLKKPGSSQLYFSNIPAGEYTFELKASYDGEDFSETVSSEVFEVNPPFYLQVWFVVLAILFLLAIGFLINRFYRQLQNLGVLRTAVDQESKRKVIAEQQFKNVWASSQDGMLLTLEGEEILTVNPAFAGMMRCSVKELEGRPISVLFQDEDRQDFYLEVLLKHVRRSPGKGMSIETPIQWKTGVLEMEVYSVMLEGDYKGRSLVLSVFKDISAKKSVQNKLMEAKEKAEEASRFKTSLLSNISHEIRTPLNGIIGGAEHIKMSRKKDPELHSQLDIILQSGERLLGTINSLLDIAKIEANKMPVVYTNTDVREFLEAIILPHKAAASRKMLKLDFKFLGTAGHANVDRRFLEMILNNLLGNSIKYTEKGTVSVTCQRVDDSLLLEVTDSGVGISEEFQSRMFDPFEQESKGNDRLYEGTGLGLSITRNLVQLMGGKIQVWSTKNEGTRVLVEIPLFEQ